MTVVAYHVMRNSGTSSYSVQDLGSQRSLGPFARLGHRCRAASMHLNVAWFAFFPEGCMYDISDVVAFHDDDL